VTVRVAVEHVDAATAGARRAARLAAHLRGLRGVEVHVAPPPVAVAGRHDGDVAVDADVAVVVTPEGARAGGPSTVAWIDADTARRDADWGPVRPDRWVATSATAAVAMARRWPGLRPVIAEPPGDPDARPLDSPDVALRRNVVVPADGLDADRLCLVLDAYSTVPGDEPLVVVGADVPTDDRRVRCVPDAGPGVRRDLIRRAVVTVLAGRDQPEPGPAVEAFGLGSGVVVCSDGGAVRELVRDRCTGRVVAPDVAALAEVLHVQVGIPEEPVRHGARGRVVWESLTWRRCLRRLLGATWRSTGAGAGA